MPLRRTAHGTAALKRRDYLSKKWFQLRIVGAYIAVLVAGAGGLVLYLGRFCRAKLRVEMFRGHSTAASPWEILRAGVITADLVAAAAVVAVAIALTVAIGAIVTRAARRVADNLRGSIGGLEPESWAPPPRLPEFRQLQQLLADALARHRLRVAELREMTRILGERVREARGDLALAGSSPDAAAIRELRAQCERARDAARAFALPDPGPDGTIADGDGDAIARDEESRNVRIGFQVHWILRFSLVSLAGSALMLATMQRAFSTGLGTDFKAAFFVLKHYRELLLPILGFSVLFYIVVVSALTALIVLLLSHRIAGPIFRLERFAEHLARGDLRYGLQRRAGDELRNLMSAAHRLRARLLDALAPLPGHFARIDEAWAALDTAAPAMSREGTAQALAAVAEQLASIRESLSPPGGETR